MLQSFLTFSRDLVFTTLVCSVKFTKNVFLVIIHIYILGTGKTLLANAVASEANVPIFSFKGSELDEVDKIRDLFEVFHDTNDDTGSCVIFIDDIETLGCKFKNESTMKF